MSDPQYTRKDAGDRAERIAELLAARPNVAQEAAEVQRARRTSIESARLIARRLRPSGGLGKELREHPLQVLGIIAAIGVVGLRWLTRSRSSRSTSDDPRSPSEGAGVVSAFAAGLAAAAAEKGGRAVIDALLEPRSTKFGSSGELAATERVDETGESADDVRGRVAKR